jgi:hypothetical protein
MLSEIAVCDAGISGAAVCVDPAAAVSCIINISAVMLSVFRYTKLFSFEKNVNVGPLYIEWSKRS